jgi:hypothetical protein
MARRGHYFGVVSTYIHLNPARAGSIEAGAERLVGYRWSSYPWYLKPHRTRPGWLNTERVMGNVGLEPGDRGRVRGIHGGAGAGVGNEGWQEGVGGGMEKDTAWVAFGGRVFNDNNFSSGNNNRHCLMDGV